MWEFTIIFLSFSSWTCFVDNDQLIVNWIDFRCKQWLNRWKVSTGLSCETTIKKGKKRKRKETLSWACCGLNRLEANPNHLERMEHKLKQLMTQTAGTESSATERRNEREKDDADRKTQTENSFFSRSSVRLISALHQFFMQNTSNILMEVAVDNVPALIYNIVP